jgi:hypothetical protein
MENENIILSIEWNRDDIQQAFMDEGIDFTDDAMQQLLTDQNLRFIEEESIERGWEVLRTLVRQLEVHA